MAVQKTLNKPEFTKCKYETDCNGCAIYPERPKGCRIYSCQWLVSDTIDEKYFPKSTNFIVNKENNNTYVIVYENKNVDRSLLRSLIDELTSKNFTVKIRHK